MFTHQNLDFTKIFIRALSSRNGGEKQTKSKIFLGEFTSSSTQMKACSIEHFMEFDAAIHMFFYGQASPKFARFLCL